MVLFLKQEDFNIVICLKLGYFTMFKLYHSQNCCEDVYIEDISRDLDDLVGYPLLLAENF